ncbi:MAG: sensor histidine kinase [Chitinophagaceae bacterium]
MPPPAIQQHLVTIGNELINSSSFAKAAPCYQPVTASPEELYDTALLNVGRGNWQCSQAILQSIDTNRIKLTALQACQLQLAWAEYFTLHQLYDSAETYAILAGAAATEGKWRHEKARALLLLSIGGLKRRNISAAYLWADSALLITRQTGDENLEAKVLCQLALCARRHFTAFAKRSFPYFLIARVKAIATGDSLTLGTIDLYLGTDNFELGQWAEGYPYFKEGVALSLQNNNYHQAYLSYSVIGYAFQLGEAYRESLPVFIKALKLSQQHQQPYDIQHCYHDIARNYQHLHQYDSALLYANLAGSVPGVDSFWANVWDTKAAIYNDMGDFKTAAAMYQKSMDWFREDFLYRNQDQLSGYEAKLNTQEKELQVTQEKKKALQLEWMIGGIAGLLVIAAWAFTVQRKAGHKLFTQNKLIQKQRTALEQSLGEKEMLLKEIHHRVKNNLTVIGSMLELQSNGIEDATARAALAAGQNRVSSMALIHQRLYQHENLAAIEFGGFVKDLTRQISSVFKKAAGEVQIEIQVGDTLLDIDTAMPLGLIMNELLTNSYKYAFNGAGTGAIYIELQELQAGIFILTYTDNGPGIASNIDPKTTRSMGLRLIHQLSRQLGGNATYQYANGTRFIIQFKDSNTRNQ